MTDKPFPVPTIHSNGTSREQLLKQVCEAHFAVTKAIEAHRARVSKLVDVLTELARLAEEIADAP